MKKLFKIVPPIMPDYVRFEKETQLKQDGFKVDGGFDIANFTPEEADEFAELMKSEFLKHYSKRKSQKIKELSK